MQNTPILWFPVICFLAACKGEPSNTADATGGDTGDGTTGGASCGADGTCPEGFVCGEENVCVPDTGSPCAGVDCSGNGTCQVQQGEPVCNCDPGYVAMGLMCVEDGGTTPECGNGAVEEGEACDSGDLQGTTCVSLGFDGGRLSCSPGCTFDTSGCTGGNQDSPLGTNLLGLRDWHPYWPFVDAFKASRPWISGSTNGTWDDGRSLDLDEDGWVRSLQADQVARTIVFWSSASVHVPGGPYVVLYDGQGTIEYAGSWQKDEPASSPGRDVVLVDPMQAGNMIMNITSVDPNDHLRNIRVILPGGVCANDPMRWCDDGTPCDGGGNCERFEDNYGTQVFHPTFLRRTRRYRLLRFMDWMETNDSTISTWDERPRPSTARWSKGVGVPVEVMVDLANRLGMDAWFCIPHLADDAYVQNLAAYVRDHLDPDRKAYIEYSNEIWNGIFAQSAYAEQEGLAANLSNDPNQARLFFYSRRAVEIFQIFESEFGGTDRIVRVMGSQAANGWVSEQVLGFEDAAQYTDALAVAPYFGGYLGRPDQEANVSSMSLDDLYLELRDVAVPAAIAWMQEHASVADAYGVSLIAYEGGQHLAGVGAVQNNGAVNALFDSINRDPRMGELYQTYLTAWRESGGELLVHFTDVYGFSPYGRWGSLEYLDQPREEAPKFDALMTFIDENPRWW